MKNNSLRTNKKIDWERVLVYGISLGWMVSTLYLMLLLTAKVTF